MGKITVLRIGPATPAEAAPDITAYPIDNWWASNYLDTPAPWSDITVEVSVTFQTTDSPTFDFWVERTAGDSVMTADALVGSKGQQTGGQTFQITFTRTWIGSQGGPDTKNATWTVYTDDGGGAISREGFVVTLGYGDQL